MRDRAPRHRLERRVIRILYDRDSAGPLDLDQSDRTVGEQSAEDDADHARPERQGGAAEQRIDRRAVAVLARAAGDAHAVALHGHVVARRSDVDAGRGDRLAVLGVCGRKVARPGEDARQHAANAGSTGEGQGVILLMQEADQPAS